VSKEDDWIILGDRSEKINFPRSEVVDSRSLGERYLRTVERYCSPSLDAAHVQTGGHADLANCGRKLEKKARPPGEISPADN